MFETIALILFALGGVLDGWRDYVMEGFETVKSDLGISLTDPLRERRFVYISYSNPPRYKENPAIPRWRFLWGLINILWDRWHLLKTGAYACFALGAFIAGMTAHPWITAIIGWAIVRPPFQNTTLFSKIYGRLTIRGW